MNWLKLMKKISRVFLHILSVTKPMITFWMEKEKTHLILSFSMLEENLSTQSTDKKHFMNTMLLRQSLFGLLKVTTNILDKLSKISIKTASLLLEMLRDLTISNQHLTKVLTSINLFSKKKLNRPLKNMIKMEAEQLINRNLTIF